MDRFAALVQFPEPSMTIIVAVIIVFASMFLGSVVYEFNRKRALRKHRLASEWKGVQTIMEDRGLAKGSAEHMLDFIRKHSPEHPLQAVTSRDAFNEIVEAVMTGAAKTDDVERIQGTGESLRETRVQLGLHYVPIGRQIVSTRDLHRGQWLSVRQSTEKRKWFRIVVEIVDEAFFYAQPHSLTDKSPPEFRPGDTLDCRMWREEDGRYLFNTVVAETQTNPLRWKLEHAARLKRTQSRAHYRMRHDESVTVGVLNAPADEDYANAASRTVVTRIPGRITSISAGGLAVVVEQPVAQQVLLRVPLTIPGTGPINLETRIVACDLMSAGRYLVRVAFVELDEEVQERIVKFISQHQQASMAPDSGSD